MEPTLAQCRFQDLSAGAPWEPLGSPWGALGETLGNLVTPWGAFGKALAIFGLLGTPGEPFCRPSGAFWGPWEAFLDPLKTFFQLFLDLHREILLQT